MRSSPAAIVIGLLQTVAGMLAVVLLWSTAGQRLDGWVAGAVDLAFWTYLVLRPLSVPLTWWTTTWAVDDGGVRCRTGWLARKETLVGWEEVVAVDVSQPYLHRLFGCFAVRFGLGSNQKQALRIDAVSAATRDWIADIADRAQLGSRQPAAQAASKPPVERADDAIYRIRPADYLLISITYGQFILLVPAGLSLLDQVNEWVPIPVPDLADLLSWPLLRLVALGVALVLASVGYGWLVAWLRYRGFQVKRNGPRYVTSGGMLSSETRTVTAQQVTGLKVTQNPLMRALGYGRVSVLTRDAGDQPMANLLFPVVRLATLPATLGADLSLPVEIGRSTLRLSGPARLSLAAGGVATWCGLVGLAYAIQPDWIVATTTAITMIVALLVNARWVVAARVPDRSRCYARRGIFWISHLEFDTSAVHVVESSQGVLGRLTHTWSVALHYYDGRVRCIRAVGCSPDRRAALIETVVA